MKNLALFLDVFISVGIAVCLFVAGVSYGRTRSPQRRKGPEGHEEEENAADYTCCHQGPPEPASIIPPPPPRKRNGYHPAEGERVPTCGYQPTEPPSSGKLKPPPPPRKQR